MHTPEQPEIPICRYRGDKRIRETGKTQNRGVFRIYWPDIGNNSTKKGDKKDWNLGEKWPSVGKLLTNTHKTIWK